MRPRYKASFLIGASPDGDRPTAEAVARAVMAWASVHVPSAEGVAYGSDSLVHNDATSTTFETMFIAGSEPIWGARLTRRDDSDPYLRWIYDVTVSGADRARAFTCVVSLGSTDGVYLPHRREPANTPDIVKTVIGTWGARRVHALPRTPITLATADIAKFIDILHDPKRSRPIVLVSCATDGPLVDARAIASSLAGVAHVYVQQDPSVAANLTEALPEELWCRDGEVRVYWPRALQVGSTTNRIWSRRQLPTERFDEEILSFIAEASVYTSDPDETTWGDLESRRRANLMSERREQGDLEEYVRLVELDNNATGRRVSELESEVIDLKTEVERARAAERSWREAYEDAVAGDGASPDAAKPLAPPATIREALERIAGEHPDRMVVELNGKSDIDTPFGAPEQAYAALVFLATTYHSSKTGKQPCSDFDAPLRKACGWFYRGSQSQVTMGKYEEWYTTTVAGEKLWLGQHVGIGRSKDPRYTIRIAFGWHAATKRVVIGFVGQHQETDQT